MLDIKFIREHADIVATNCKNKLDASDIDGLLVLDTRRRAIIQDVESLKSLRNTVSQEIAAMKKKGSGRNVEDCRDEGRV